MRKLALFVLPLLAVLFSLLVAVRAETPDGEITDEKLRPVWRLDPGQPSPSKQECVQQIGWMFRFLDNYTSEEIGEVAASDPIINKIKNDCAAEQADYFHGLDFVDEDHGWAAGWNGRIIATQDGGVTWQPRNSGTLTNFLSLDFVDREVGYAAGEGGVVIKTMDGGMTWKRQAVLGDVDLRKVSCVDRDRCWIASSYLRTILHTFDGGRSWNRQALSATGSPTSVYFIDKNRGWMTTVNGEILRTVDGGANWSRSLAAGARYSFSDVHFPDPDNGWAAGKDGSMFRSGDGGLTWSNASPDVARAFGDLAAGDVDFKAVRFFDSSTGWAAGLNGVIMATRDGGSNWFLQLNTYNSTNSLYGLVVIDAQTALASGNMGHIYLTLDGGAGWYPVHGLVVNFLKRVVVALRDKDHDAWLHSLQLINSKQFARAREALEVPARHQYPEAAFELSKLLSDGIGGAQDQVEAVALLKVAAAGDHPEAQYLLAQAYEQGKGTAQSLQDQLKWLLILEENARASAAQIGKARQAIDRLRLDQDADDFELVYERAKVLADIVNENARVRRLFIE